MFLHFTGNSRALAPATGSALLFSPQPQALLADGRSPRSWLLRSLAGGVIAAAAILRILYLLYDCPLDLSPDEAHYWDWSRQLAGSYYSKGPLVAYLIRASCKLLGDWSIVQTGNLMTAVRVPAVLCSSLTLLGMYMLVYRVYRSDRLALGAVLLTLTVPVFNAGALLMTIDAPYVCCWMWSLVLAHIVVSGSRAPAKREEPATGKLPRHRLPQLCWWIALGAIIGAGILAKYTMVLFLPSFALFLLFSRPHRRLLIGPGFLLMCLTMAITCTPILVWNAQHDWVTLRHVGRQAGAEAVGIHWLGPLEYLGGQFAVLHGFWFVGIALASCSVLGLLGRSRHHHRQADCSRAIEDQAFLLAFAVPMFGVFFLFSLKTSIELNWPITAYLSGGVLLAGWLARQCQSSTILWRWFSQATLAAAALLGLGGTLFIHHTEWLYPLAQGGLPVAYPHVSFSQLPAPPGQRPVRTISAGLAARPLAPSLKVRQWDPTCRLRGWQPLAQEVDRVRAELRAKGIEPVIAGTSWIHPGELAFYLPDHPLVYSLGRAFGGRYSQYDLWRPNPLGDPPQFQGKTFIIVGELNDRATSAFARVDRPRVFQHEVAGQTIATWTIVVAHGYHGFSELSEESY